MPMLILFPDKLNGRAILGQRRGKECDRRVEAEVNWAGLTLIMFIVFVHTVVSKLLHNHVTIKAVYNCIVSLLFALYDYHSTV